MERQISIRQRVFSAADGGARRPHADWVDSLVIPHLEMNLRRRYRKGDLANGPTRGQCLSLSMAVVVVQISSRYKAVARPASG